MIPALNPPVSFPNAPSPETSFDGLDPAATAGNFALLMAQAVAAPAVKTRSATGDRSNSAAFSSTSEEKDSPAQESSANQTSLDPRNIPVAILQTWLAAVPLPPFAPPIPIPLTEAKSQSEAATGSASEAGSDGGDFVAGNAPSENPRSNDASTRAGAKGAAEGNSTRPGGRQRGDASAPNPAGANPAGEKIPYDTRANSAAGPATIAPDPQRPTNQDNNLQRGKMVPDIAARPAVVEPRVAHAQSRPAATGPASPRAEFSGFEGFAPKVGLKEAALSRAIEAGVVSFVSPPGTESRVYGPRMGELRGLPAAIPALAQAAKILPAAEPVSAEVVAQVSPEAARPEVAKAGTGAKVSAEGNSAGADGRSRPATAAPSPATGETPSATRASSAEQPVLAEMPLPRPTILPENFLRGKVAADSASLTAGVEARSSVPQPMPAAAQPLSARAEASGLAGFAPVTERADSPRVPAAVVAANAVELPTVTAPQTSGANRVEARSLPVEFPARVQVENNLPPAEPVSAEVVAQVLPEAARPAAAKAGTGAKVSAEGNSAGADGRPRAATAAPSLTTEETPSATRASSAEQPVPAEMPLPRSTILPENFLRGKVAADSASLTAGVEARSSVPQPMPAAAQPLSARAEASGLSGFAPVTERADSPRVPATVVAANAVVPPLAPAPQPSGANRVEARSLPVEVPVRVQVDNILPPAEPVSAEVVAQVSPEAARPEAAKAGTGAKVSAEGNSAGADGRPRAATAAPSLTTEETPSATRASSAEQPVPAEMPLPRSTILPENFLRGKVAADSASLTAGVEARSSVPQPMPAAAQPLSARTESSGLPGFTPVTERADSPRVPAAVVAANAVELPPAPAPQPSGANRVEARSLPVEVPVRVQAENILPPAEPVSAEVVAQVSPEAARPEAAKAGTGAKVSAEGNSAGADGRSRPAPAAPSPATGETPSATRASSAEQPVPAEMPLPRSTILPENFLRGKVAADSASLTAGVEARSSVPQPMPAAAQPLSARAEASGLAGPALVTERADFPRVSATVVAANAVELPTVTTPQTSGANRVEARSFPVEVPVRVQVENNLPPAEPVSAEVVAQVSPEAARPEAAKAGTGAKVSAEGNSAGADGRSRPATAAPSPVTGETPSATRASSAEQPTATEMPLPRPATLPENFLRGKVAADSASLTAGVEARSSVPQPMPAAAQPLSARAEASGLSGFAPVTGRADSPRVSAAVVAANAVELPAVTTPQTSGANRVEARSLPVEVPVRVQAENILPPAEPVSAEVVAQVSPEAARPEAAKAGTGAKVSAEGNSAGADGRSRPATAAPSPATGETPSATRVSSAEQPVLAEMPLPRPTILPENFLRGKVAADSASLTAGVEARSSVPQPMPAAAQPLSARAESSGLPGFTPVTERADSPRVPAAVVAANAVELPAVTTPQTSGANRVEARSLPVEVPVRVQAENILPPAEPVSAEVVAQVSPEAARPEAAKAGTGARVLAEGNSAGADGRPRVVATSANPATGELPAATRGSSTEQPVPVEIDLPRPAIPAENSFRGKAAVLTAAADSRSHVPQPMPAAAQPLSARAEASGLSGIAPVTERADSPRVSAAVVAANAVVPPPAPAPQPSGANRVEARSLPVEFPVRVQAENILPPAEPVSAEVVAQVSPEATRPEAAKAGTGAKVSAEGNSAGADGRSRLATAAPSPATGETPSATRASSAEQPVPAEMPLPRSTILPENFLRGKVAADSASLTADADSRSSVPQPMPAAAQPLSARAESSGLARIATAAEGNDTIHVPMSVVAANTVVPPVVTASQLSGANRVEARSFATELPERVQAEKILPSAEPVSAEDVSQTPPDTSRPTVTAGHRPALVPPVSERGTPPAEHASTMKAVSEMNENAGVVEQNLPTLPTTLEVAAPAGRERKARTSALDFLAPLPSGTTEAASGLTDFSTRVGLTTRAEAEVESPQTHLVEGVRRAVENATAGLKRIEGNSVAVEIRPDENTQLALHVKLHQGRFEVQAVLERGDFAAFSAEWPQLQNRLAEQGVRLASLVASAENSHLSSGGRPSSEERGREELPSEAQSIPVPPKPETRRFKPRPAAAADEREWWA